MWFAVLALVALARVLGIVSIGLVTTGSMAPVLPPGSLFVAFPGHADVGDVVVYEAPDGATVVHRVVDVGPEGLVTKGDANAATDQESGVPPVPPDDVQVVPTVGATPLAVRGPWVRPLGLAALQVGLLTFGLRGLLARRRAGGHRDGLERVRPHHLVACAALVLLVSAPLFHQEVEAFGTMHVPATMVPTVVRIEAPDGVAFHAVPAMGEATVDARGPVEVMRAPDLPGARIAGGSPLAAMLPAVLLLAAVALLMRLGGW